MVCNLIRDNLLAYLEKDLTAPMMEEFEKHVNGCPECALILSEFKHIAMYIEEEKALEPRVFAETRLLEGINSRLEEQRVTPLNWVVKNLQPAFLSIVVISAIAIGVLIGMKGELQYTDSKLTDEQIESMRLDLNVPDFMDEENTSLN